MNCLICRAHPRTQSDNKENPHGYETAASRRGKSCCLDVTRRWSGDLTRSTYEAIKTVNASGSSDLHKKAKSHLRNEGIEIEPRLVRSSGMRRDWSFEDLRLRDQKKGRFH